MAGEAFFVPGSTARSWNKDTPSTRILVRNDLYQQVRPLLSSLSVCLLLCLQGTSSWTPPGEHQVSATGQ